MSLNQLQKHLGTKFDARQEKRGSHWIQVRYNGKSVTIPPVVPPAEPIVYKVSPNPIVIDKGVIVHREIDQLTGEPEAYQTYYVKLVQTTIQDHIDAGLAIATPGRENEFTLNYALRTNSRWDLSLDSGQTWKQCKIITDVKYEPVRVWLILVPLGIGET
jgi:hypothetical protein